MISHPSILKVNLSADIPPEARTWRNDISVRRWCRQYSLITENQQEIWEEQIGNSDTIKMFGIMVDTKTPVGVCGITSIDRVNQKAEISIYLEPKSQNKGYESDALWLLLMHSFREQNLNRLWAESFQDNPNHKMLIDLGFELEGKLNQSYFREGKFIGSVLFGLTRGRFNELYRGRFNSDSEPRASGVESLATGLVHALATEGRFGTAERVRAILNEAETIFPGGSVESTLSVGRGDAKKRKTKKGG